MEIKNNHYSLENPPIFKQNDDVEVDFSIIYPGGKIKKGKIIGLSSKLICEFWIVNFDEPLENGFTACTVPHTTIVKR